ncbi:MAG: membrane protein insertase YidC [Erysipelotrichaceae bacterium]|nr:membrane protein insertase YidC [Erysipelotrichaceae bacterium]
MTRLLKNKKLILSLIVLVSLSGCMATDFIITLDTPFSTMWSGSNSWFEALFVFPLAQALNWLTPYVTVTGAIILCTILVKLLTFGLTVKSTVASQKMQTIQPELTKIQAKYAGKNDNESKMKMSQEMNGLYAKHNINPFGAIGTMFIQFPVIIAMYTAVQHASAVKTSSLFGYALSNSPQQAISAGQWLFVIIFVLMGVSQFVSMKLPMWLNKAKAKKQPVRLGDKPAKAPNTDMMMYTSMGMILFFAFTWPTAMSLYWFVSSAAQIAQTYYIQKAYIEKEVV